MRDVHDDGSSTEAAARTMSWMLDWTVASDDNKYLAIAIAGWLAALSGWLAGFG